VCRKPVPCRCTSKNRQYMSVIYSQSMQKSREKGIQKWREKRKEAVKAKARSKKQSPTPTTKVRQKRANEVRRQSKPVYPLVQKKPRKPIKRISDKRAAQNKEYLILRKAYLRANPFCAVYPKQQATQIHHKKGRIGKLLTDIKYFLPVSDEGHQKIEMNPNWAKEMGYSLSRLGK